MKKLRWPLLIVLVALAAIAVLLYSRQTELTPILPEEIKPATGGVYVEGVIGSMSRLNPVLDLYNAGDHDIDRLIFSGLIRFDDHGQPVGDLAESWGISLDGTVYNFSLRPNAFWHDGEPVTSDDIIFTIDLMRSDDSILSPDVRELWNTVEINRLDDKMLQFRLPEPYAPFLDYLSFGILPSHVVGDTTFADLVNSPFNLHPVGSGPYRFERLIVEDGQIAGVLLTVYDKYYGQRAFIEQFVIRYYPDGQAALAAYRNGDIMGISQITPEVLADALKEPNLRLYTGRLPEMSITFLNLDNPEVAFFKDAQVRRALLLGLNRQWMVDRLLNGQAIIADGPIFPNTWAYFEGVEHVAFDPDAAINILKEAGYNIPAEGGDVRVGEDGLALQFELLYPDDPQHTAIAEAMKSDWKRIGVGVTTTPIPYDELVGDFLDTRLYHAALIDLNLMRSPDPDPYPFWHQTQVTGGQNYSKWNDFQASEYLEMARVAVDQGERIKNYRNFQVRFTQELPALPMFYPVYTYAVDAQVQGVSMGPLFDPSERFATVTQWFLLSKRVAVDESSTEALTPTPAE
ncbi:MAG: hypothetical protein EHM70_21830 [Chloroflexota bacterium]|nr:MAG: hypothetical protein EHM70_21830 [Chloroflexota bacterium]